MGVENKDGEDRELPLSNLSSKARGLADRCTDVRQSHAPSTPNVKRHFAVAVIPSISTLQNPGTKPPGVFFESESGALSVAATAVIGNEARHEHPGDEFHDSELGDIFTLYNACNGVVLDGLLDVRKLDELSDEELEVLNVTRLREIWLHTVSGCRTCAGIIRRLNAVRCSLGDEEEEMPRRANSPG